VITTVIQASQRQLKLRRPSPFHQRSLWPRRPPTAAT